MVVTLSFDIEEFDFPLERGKDISLEQQIEVSTEGLLSLLALLEKHSIRATFYVTANFAMHKAELIREIAKQGHEVASHDYFHTAGRVSNPVEAKKVLEEISGTTVIGFRSPRLGRTSSAELATVGYKYNSSMNPTFIPFRYNNLTKPRAQFHDGEILNYPTSVSSPLRIPLFWLSLHVMSFGLYKLLAKSAIKRDKHLNLYFHPWEFSSQLKNKDFGVPEYISNCSGEKLLSKLERLIVFLASKNYKFITTKEYLFADE